jgi:CsbD-like.
MSYADKARNEAEELKGRTKEWVGDKTDNEQLEAEGKAEQLKARARQAGEHVKDAAHDAAEEFR